MGRVGIEWLKTARAWFEAQIPRMWYMLGMDRRAVCHITLN